MMKQTILFGIIVGFTVGRPSVQPESGSRKLQRTENREEMELFPIGKSHDMVFRSGYSRIIFEIARNVVMNIFVYSNLFV